MSTQLLEIEWRDFSSRLVESERLPFGTELRLYKGDAKKRGDFRVKMKRVYRWGKPRMGDGDRVSDLIRFVPTMLSTELEARQLEIRVYGPDKKKIPANTLLKTVKKLAPRPTAQDIAEQEMLDGLIADVQADAEAAIKKSERLVDDPSSVVCPAYVKALVERFGSDLIREHLNGCD